MQWNVIDQKLKYLTILEKLTKSFFKFSVAEFYFCLSEYFLRKSLKFAGNYTSLPYEALSLIKNTCKSVL